MGDYYLLHSSHYICGFLEVIIGRSFSMRQWCTVVLLVVVAPSSTKSSTKSSTRSLLAAEVGKKFMEGFHSSKNTFWILFRRVL